MAYELPIASNLTLGGVKIGAGLTIDTDGILDIKDLDLIKDTITYSLENIIAGKTLIANAITEKGVDTRFDDTFQQIANNILNISSGSGIDFIMEVGSPNYSLTAIYFELEIQPYVKEE